MSEARVQADTGDRARGVVPALLRLGYLALLWVLCTMVLGLLAGQALLFVALKLWIGMRFADNPGGTVEFHLVRNLFMASYEIATFVALDAGALARPDLLPRFSR